MDHGRGRRFDAGPGGPQARSDQEVGCAEVERGLRRAGRGLRPRGRDVAALALDQGPCRTIRAGIRTALRRAPRRPLARLGGLAGPALAGPAGLGSLDPHRHPGRGHAVRRLDRGGRFAAATGRPDDAAATVKHHPGGTIPTHRPRGGFARQRRGPQDRCQGDPKETDVMTCTGHGQGSLREDRVNRSNANSLYPMVRFGQV